MVDPVVQIADAGAPVETLAELLDRLPDIPPERIRMFPYPGTATERDLLEAVESKRGRTCELVDGILIESATGFYEARLACVLIERLESFNSGRDLGIGFAAGAPVRTGRGRVRLPDVSFFLWPHFPRRLLPPGQILDMLPDLVVEILSPKNTARETGRKRSEFFAGGARLVWEVEPATKAVNVYTAVDQFHRVGEEGTLDGGTVLPGFVLSVRSWFERAGRRAEGP